MKYLLTGLGAIVLFPLLIIYGGFSSGFVLYKAWGWFMPLVYQGVPSLSFHGAIALCLLFSCLKGYRVTADYSYKGVAVKADHPWLPSLLAPWIMLLVLWLFTLVL